MKKKNLHRINARLSSDIATKLEELLKLSGDNLSEVIVKAIDAYHADICKSQILGAQVLRKNNFIACASGSENLSEHYKKVLTQSLTDKV